MTDRPAEIAAFLNRAGWGSAERFPVSGDASGRRYERLIRNPDRARAILMDAPGAECEKIPAFVKIDRHLRSLGLSAPEIYASETKKGLLLLEDLGDRCLATEIDGDPALEQSLYAAAVDVLVTLQHHPVPRWVPAYSPDIMAEYTAPAFDVYLVQTTAQNPAARAACMTELQKILMDTPYKEPVLVLRDYHSENLIWQPDRQGVAHIGLLDFQDAVSGHPAYDLVSLLEDARRDVTDRTRSAMIARFADATGMNLDALQKDLYAQGAQRNLRILGVLARLCVDFGRPGYTRFLPRVWANLRRDLSHPALGNLRSLIVSTLPEPTPEILKELDSRCRTHRTP